MVFLLGVVRFMHSPLLELQTISIKKFKPPPGGQSHEKSFGGNVAKEGLEGRS